MGFKLDSIGSEGLLGDRKGERKPGWRKPVRSQLKGKDERMAWAEVEAMGEKEK